MKTKWRFLKHLVVLSSVITIWPSPGLIRRGHAGPALIKGEEYSPLAVDGRRLDWRPIIIRDVLADYNSTYLPAERRVGFSPHSYHKFVLRDSKLSCFIRKYDYRRMEIFRGLRKGDRISVTGRIKRIGKGIERWINPRFVILVKEISRGWVLDEDEAVLASGDPPGAAEYREIVPEELVRAPDQADGECVRFQDKFSLLSTSYTNFEKDLNLSNDTALKFRGEFLPWPCYLPRDEENQALLSRLRMGDKITVSGRLLVREAADDRLVLVQVHRITQGWNQARRPADLGTEAENWAAIRNNLDRNLAAASNVKGGWN